MFFPSQDYSSDTRGHEITSGDRAMTSFLYFIFIRVFFVALSLQKLPLVFFAQEKKKWSSGLACIPETCSSIFIRSCMHSIKSWGGGPIESNGWTFLRSVPWGRKLLSAQTQNPVLSRTCYNTRRSRSAQWLEFRILPKTNQLKNRFMIILQSWTKRT